MIFVKAILEIESPICLCRRLDSWWELSWL